MAGLSCQGRWPQPRRCTCSEFPQAAAEPHHVVRSTVPLPLAVCVHPRQSDCHTSSGPLIRPQSQVRAPSLTLSVIISGVLSDHWHGHVRGKFTILVVAPPGGFGLRRAEALSDLSALLSTALATELLIERLHVEV